MKFYIDKESFSENLPEEVEITTLEELLDIILSIRQPCVVNFNTENSNWEIVHPYEF